MPIVYSFAKKYLYKYSTNKIEKLYTLSVHATKIILFYFIGMFSILIFSGYLGFSPNPMVFLLLVILYPIGLALQSLIIIEFSKCLFSFGYDNFLKETRSCLIFFILSICGLFPLIFIPFIIAIILGVRLGNIKESFWSLNIKLANSFVYFGLFGVFSILFMLVSYLFEVLFPITFTLSFLCLSISFIFLTRINYYIRNFFQHLIEKKPILYYHY